MKYYLLGGSLLRIITYQEVSLVKRVEKIHLPTICCLLIKVAPQKEVVQHRHHHFVPIAQTREESSANEKGCEQSMSAENNKTHSLLTLSIKFTRKRTGKLILHFKNVYGSYMTSLNSRYLTIICFTLSCNMHCN